VEMPESISSAVGIKLLYGNCELNFRQE